MGAETLYFVDLLGEAEIESPSPDHVELQRVTIGRTTKMAVFQHPPSTVRFAPVMLGTNPRLVMSIGIKPGAWDRFGGDMLFEVFHEGAIRQVRLSAESLAPASGHGDRAWRSISVDLAPYAGRRFRLVLRTSAEALAHAWAVWGDPRIHHTIGPRPPVKPRRSQAHIFLITADALGSDRLRAYGNAGAATPHIDRLARDGCRFEHGRSQSPATLASYATMLTGRYPHDNGILAEWGELTDEADSLPERLRRRGYHTVMIPSERELSHPGLGISALFDEHRICLANPAQEGSVTTRSFERWLDERPDSPCFVWLEYFDTHPPSLPPEPFAHLYYQSDPAQAASRADGDVGKIRGVESVQVFEHALARLEEGIADYDVACRLRDTARALSGQLACGPDLATHLRANGENPGVVSRWLFDWANKLFAGEVPSALTSWIKSQLPKLRDIEREILAWLEGVTDPRYPEAMHLGSVSYFDDQVGRVSNALKEHDAYDQSLIVVTSPHGESFGTRGVYFHHHALLECVLRVPVVIKAPTSSRAVRGASVGGIFDLIDLMPTLLQAAGGGAPGRGTSRWQHVLDGNPIPPHDSLAVGMNGVMTSLIRHPYKLVRAEHDHALSDQWSWRAGDHALFHAGDDPADSVDRAGERPEITRQMLDALDEVVRTTLIRTR